MPLRSKIWRRRLNQPLALYVTVVGGKHDGKTVAMRPPLPRTFERDGVRYRVDRVENVGHVAVTDVADPHTPVVAWRAWNVKEEPGRMVRLASGPGMEWTMEGPLVAQCRVTRGDLGPSHDPTIAPFDNCSCGIYCTTTLANLRNAGFAQPDVFGLLAGWGRVAPHEFGYRVQRAYPLAIIVNSTSTTFNGAWMDDAVGTRIRIWSQDLRAVYRVPVMRAMPEKAVEVAAGMITGGIVERWVARVAPTDVRLTLSRKKKEAQHPWR